MDEKSFNEIVTKLNDPQFKLKVAEAVKKVLEEEGIELTPEAVAEFTARATQKDDSAEILAAGAVFVTTAALIFSDRRLKSDVELVGRSESGISIYEFSYKGFSTRWRGVLAQELLGSFPDAVLRHPLGFLAVDYGKIDVQFRAA